MGGLFGEYVERFSAKKNAFGFIPSIVATLHTSFVASANLRDLRQTARFHLLIDVLLEQASRSFWKTCHILDQILNSTATPHAPARSARRTDSLKSTSQSPT